jgi:hypothetical protein
MKGTRYACDTVDFFMSIVLCGRCLCADTRRARVCSRTISRKAIYFQLSGPLIDFGGLC